MDFEQLGEAWRRQPVPAPPVESLQLVQQRAERLHQIVRKRDRIETGLALVMLPIFAVLAVVVRHDVSRIGAAIIALACIGIPLRMRAARRSPSDPGQPLLLQLRLELSRIEAQNRLLSTVLWWYFAPLGLGVILFVGGVVPMVWGIVYGLVVVVIYGGLLQLNRRAVRIELEPRAQELRSWINHLEQGT